MAQIGLGWRQGQNNEHDSESADTVSLDPSLGDTDSIWNVDVPLSLFNNTPRTSLSQKGNSTGQGAFINLGFMDSLDEDKLNAAFLQNHIQTTRNTVAIAQTGWLKYHSDLKKNKEEVKLQIQNRKEELIELVKKEAHKLENHIDTLMKSHEDNCNSLNKDLMHMLEIIDNIENDEVGKVYHQNGDSTTSDSKQPKRKSLQMYNSLQEIQNKAQLTSNLVWMPLELKYSDQTKNQIAGLFGSIKIDERQQHFLNPCDVIEMVRKISCKTKYDEMPCGIVDMTVTPRGDILVADKSNKMVKMYDREGSFVKIVGQEDLQDPIRLTVLRNSGGFLVADNYMHFIKLFDNRGGFVKNFINDMKYPTSLCETCHGDILISEYSSKCVIAVNNLGVHKYMFPSKLANPAHIACGPQGHVVISDWKNHILKVFHNSGKSLWEYNLKGSGVKQINQPQGVCFDPIGNILIADTKNHRIQCIDEKGGNIYPILNKSDGLRLPMSVHCDSNGLLYVAEYQGNVKIFRYMEKQHNLEDDGIPLTDVTSEGETAISTQHRQSVSTEDVKLDDSCQETIL